MRADTVDYPDPVLDENLGAKGTRVLIVDESPTYLVFAENALRGIGCQIVTSSDIWIAPIVSRFRPSLVLLGVYFGSFSGGINTVHLLRNGKNCHRMRIVLLSSMPPVELQELAKECRADGFISKPDSADGLLAQVQVYLSGTLRTPSRVD